MDAAADPTSRRRPRKRWKRWHCIVGTTYTTGIEIVLLINQNINSARRCEH